MDSNMQSLPLENSETTKATFRKPSSDMANRNYRRRSPANGSSSSDGSPKCEHSSSPMFSRGDRAKVPEHQQRWKDDDRELDREFGRSQYGRSGDSYGKSDRHSSRNSHGYSRHDDYSRNEKRADNDGRHYHSGRESRSANHSDHIREESDISRSRDYMQNVDKYSRDRYDISGHRNKDKERESLSMEHRKLKDKDLSPDRAGSSRKNTNSTSEEKDRNRHRWDRDGRDDRRDYHRNSGDRKSDRIPYYEESKGHRNESFGRDSDGHHYRESHKNDSKELNGQRERRNHDDWETSRDKDRYSRAPGEQNEAKSGFGSENQESVAKRPKLFSSDKDAECIGDTDENQSSSAKQAQEVDDKVAVGQAHADNSEAANDLNAAKVAAMRAAELVNRNLVGMGFMSTEQKKKLLWGNKNSTASEESGCRWDTAMFGDRERQEKFNKLMGVKGNMNVDHKPDNQVEAEKQKELQMDLEKQYTAGLRRRDGRTVGLGL